MQNIIEKTNVLIEALPYIQKFRGETVVLKFGGSIMENEEGVKRILEDVTFMACIGLCPVIVHGGGKAISTALRKAGLRSDFVKGLRVTAEATINVVEHVLNHEINPEIVEILANLNCEARGIHGDDILRVIKHTQKDAETDEVLDWGYVGEVVDVDPAPVKAFLKSGITPVITPLGRGKDKKVYNVNADEAAASIAQALKARKLVFLSDVPGLLENPSDPQSLFSTVKVSNVADLIERGVIGGGMLPKIKGAVKALEAGVQKAHIIDAGTPHSLLLELFTERGVGTEIVHE